MEVNAIIDGVVKIYKVQDRLDVVNGKVIQFEFSGEVPEGLEVYTNNDPVLTLDKLKMTASAIGQSKIRIMNNMTIVKDIDIIVVDSVSPNATALNGSLGSPQPK